MGVFDRISNAIEIFLECLKFIWRDKSLLIVPILMIIFNSIFLLIFFSFFIIKSKVIVLIISFSLIYAILIYFINSFFSAIQSWMVYEVAQNKDATFVSGLKRALKEIPDIIAYSITAIIISMIVSNIKGKAGTIGEVAGSFISFITSIAGKLVMPAMIITERNFVESIKQLRKAVKRWPEILLFEIGIGPLNWIIIIINLVIFIPLAVFISPIVGITTFLIIFVIQIIFSLVINQVYYSILYIALIERKKVSGIDIKKFKRK